MKLKVEDLYEYARTTVLGCGRFPDLELTARQRRVMGSRIFTFVHDFVGQVGRGMCAFPYLFALARYPVTGEALLERQRRASAWRLVANAFLLLHYWANDWYLLEQSTAVLEAQAVLDQVEAEEADPSCGDRYTWWRRMVLTSPFQVLEKRRRKAREAARKGNADRKKG